MARGFTKFRQPFAKGGISMGKVEECKYCKPNSINYALGYDLGVNGGSLHCPMCGRKVEV